MAGERPVFIAKFLGGNLIEQVPSELERLGKKALYLEAEQARPAAEELVKRAIEVLRHLGPVLMHRPDLLKGKAVKRFDMPVLIALSRSHRYYYKRVLHQLRGLKIGSQTGIAWSERANWKSEGSTGRWALILYHVAEMLRTNDPPGDHEIETYALEIRTKHPYILEDARKLEAFGPDSVDAWIKKVCLPVLYVLRPDLRLAKRGRRKRKDKERADPRVKKQRDAIVARIRAVVENPQVLSKAHSWTESSRKS